MYYFSQVSLVASDDIQFLSWNRNTLRKLLKKENFLKNVFESVIGQDVTKKLLALTRNVSELRPGATAFKASSILYLHQDIIEAGRPISRESMFLFHFLYFRINIRFCRATDTSF